MWKEGKEIRVLESKWNIVYNNRGKDFLFVLCKADKKVWNDETPVFNCNVYNTLYSSDQKHLKLLQSLVKAAYLKKKSFGKQSKMRIRKLLSPFYQTVGHCFF
jgi:hypothetical protein